MIRVASLVFRPVNAARAATVTAVLAATAAAALVSPALLDTDYTSIPEAPTEMARQINAVKISLTKAIEIASKAGEGVAASAQLRLGRGTPTIEVMVYGDKAWRVTVDGTSGDVASKVEISRFPGEPVSGLWTETPSGLKYFDLVVGTGEKPAGPETKVKVNYAGWFVDGMKFDASADHGGPATFALGGVIKGWTEGVGDMRVGGKRKLIIPYNLAYGEAGRPPKIHPKATLIFDVELIEIVK